VAHAEHRLTLPVRTDSDADPAVAAVLAKAKAQVGRIPNMYARMANVPGLLETYLTGYDAFRSESGLSPAEQETILLAISRANDCGYCMAAHSTTWRRSPPRSPTRFGPARRFPIRGWTRWRPSPPPSSKAAACPPRHRSKRCSPPATPRPTSSRCCWQSR